MELFWVKNGQYIKIFLIKLICIQSCTFRHFTKKIVSWRICLKRHSATFFCGKPLPNTTLEGSRKERLVWIQMMTDYYNQPLLDFRNWNKLSRDWFKINSQLIRITFIGKSTIFSLFLMKLGQNYQVMS